VDSTLPTRVMRPEKAKLTAAERDGLLKILRANVKAAKATILGREAELKAAFEIQLDTRYPPDGDPLWIAEYEAAVRECQVHIDRIEQRCNELGIGTRYRPHLHPPSWSYGGEQLFSDLRADRRRVAHAQIAEKLKHDCEELERKSAIVIGEIIANGFVTEAAQEFLAKLPTPDGLVPPLRLKELASLVEGKALPSKTLTGMLETLTGEEQRRLKE
jgi:hypothetical protein